MAAECDARVVYWNRAYDQGSRERDSRLKQVLSQHSVAAESPKANQPLE
ncbi:deoxyribodipyrimidine photo-lyase [Reyranella soli]